ncbi:MAG TPA: hypothetical protein VLV16_15295 [Gemmatimonadales bacterium]|nr:hypothetical protein [Gemmatimonadales bacterium]
MLIVAVLLFTVLLRLIIITVVVYLLLPAGPLCPHCKIDMVPIRNRFVDTFLPMLQRRWCLECGWNGVTRRIRAARTPSGTTPRSPRTTPQGPPRS